MNHFDLTILDSKTNFSTFQNIGGSLEHFDDNTSRTSPSKLIEPEDNLIPAPTDTVVNYKDSNKFYQEAPTYVKTEKDNEDQNQAPLSKSYFKKPNTSNKDILKRASPRTYGMRLEGSHGYVWNVSIL